MKGEKRIQRVKEKNNFLKPLSKSERQIGISVKGKKKSPDFPGWPRDVVNAGRVIP